MLLYSFAGLIGFLPHVLNYGHAGNADTVGSISGMVWAVQK